MSNIVRLVRKVEIRVKALFEGEGTGHDWWHIVRVVNNAKYLAEQEKADKSLVELAALLHDVGDHKFHKEENAQEILIRELLEEENASEFIIERVLEIVKTVSYKGAGVDTTPTSLEGQIVQDADRLDAIGAIGIARAFAYGGNKNRLLYHPDQAPVLHNSFEAYKSDNGHTINHFYEKLLLLKDRMQTETGKQVAEERHQFMKTYLDHFYAEWEGKSYSE